MPVTPSLQETRTITSVWRIMVVIASLWARMVGRSTSTASIDSMVGFVLSMNGMFVDGLPQVQYRLDPAKYLEGMKA